MPSQYLLIGWMREKIDWRKGHDPSEWFWRPNSLLGKQSSLGRHGVGCLCMSGGEGHKHWCRIRGKKLAAPLAVCGKHDYSSTGIQQRRGFLVASFSDEMHTGFESWLEEQKMQLLATTKAKTTNNIILGYRLV